LASVRSNVMDHLVGLDLAAFARAVGSFAADREQPTARSRRPPTNKVDVRSDA
jgi:hypothetical protein